MRRRRRTASEIAPAHLVGYRGEEWANEEAWEHARQAWVAAGRELPAFTPEDIERAEVWGWWRCAGSFADVDEWGAAVRSYEDEHGRLLVSPDAPFEPSGRGVYDYRTGRWTSPSN